MVNLKERAEELETLIGGYQNSYYNGEAEISDGEFDALWDELKAIAPESPVLQRIGADSGTFPKARHIMPMGSQEKAANPEEFRRWAEKHPYGEYLVEHKLDGASLELQYEGGELLRAVTRGDGAVGDDITANARKMQGVLPRLGDDSGAGFSGGVRGEVIMTHHVHRAFFRDKANCRNAANGLMKRKDGEGSERLQFIAYDAFCPENPPFADEAEKIAWLTKAGFFVTPLFLCKSAEEVVALREKIEGDREAIDWDIDGLVVKGREIDLEDAGRARPEKQIAFKFSLEEAETVLRQVEWSESGATYTPIALFDPVSLGGTQVKRASLVNPAIIEALGVKIGCTIGVTKRGEIIPKVERVLGTPPDAEAVPIPETCASCGAALVNEGTRLYCPNGDCPKRILHRLQKWAAVLDIREFGETLIGYLFDSRRVRSIYDLYTLTVQDLTPFFLQDESLAKEKRSLGAEKAVQSLYARTTVTLPVFAAGFDIEGIGVTLMEKLCAAGFDTLDKLLGADAESIAQVNGFAEITARALVEGLAACRDEMLRLVGEGKITIQAPRGEQKLAGKSFCFTGELRSMKRGDAERMVKEAGGATKSSVTRDLSFLVTNDRTSGSGKNARAAELGIPVISEEEFLAMVAAP
ncbi:MAG: NAD-dependent DNA ligase LigA [Spirochaetaceae bacterium]|jgi:DNA ligase (NAD+)|nr:NAD-dependent DNA ligase LigA [Spirochaetaceae bacterium]